MTTSARPARQHVSILDALAQRHTCEGSAVLLGEDGTRTTFQWSLACVSVTSPDGDTRTFDADALTAMHLSGTVSAHSRLALDATSVVRRCAELTSDTWTSTHPTLVLELRTRDGRHLTLAATLDSELALRGLPPSTRRLDDAVRAPLDALLGIAGLGVELGLIRPTVRDHAPMPQSTASSAHRITWARAPAPAVGWPVVLLVSLLVACAVTLPWFWPDHRNGRTLAMFILCWPLVVLGVRLVLARTRRVWGVLEARTPAGWRALWCSARRPETNPAARLVVYPMPETPDRAVVVETRAWIVFARRVAWLGLRAGRWQTQRFPRAARQALQQMCRAAGLAPEVVDPRSTRGRAWLATVWATGIACEVLPMCALAIGFRVLMGLTAGLD